MPLKTSNAFRYATTLGNKSRAENGDNATFLLVKHLTRQTLTFDVDFSFGFLLEWQIPDYFHACCPYFARFTPILGCDNDRTSRHTAGARLCHRSRLRLDSDHYKRTLCICICRPMLRWPDVCLVQGAFAVRSNAISLYATKWLH